AGQPGAFQAEHDPGAPERHLGNQVLEAPPVGGGGAGVALVDVDDVDPLGWPAQRDRPALQVVLPGGGLGVAGDLVEGRLADIQVGVAGQPAAVTLDTASLLMAGWAPCRGTSTGTRTVPGRGVRRGPGDGAASAEPAPR